MTLPPARVPGPCNLVLIVESIHHVLNVVFFEKHSPNFALVPSKSNEKDRRD
jgi:hypothetical protein